MTVLPLEIVILGLSVTSSWGNGHATTYRALIKALSRRGHDVLFLERDVPWYAEHRDLPCPPFGRTALYRSVTDLQARFSEEIRSANLVIVGSYVPEGASIGEWVVRTARGVTAFYDIDTPVTLAQLDGGDVAYLTRDLIPRYHLYLSFTGGPTLQRLEQQFGSPMARPLYCSVDPEVHFQQPSAFCWDLGYMGTYSIDRQPTLERLLIGTARRWPDGRFVVAGPQYPPEIAWPRNVRREHHLAPAEHRAFYNAQRFTLNVTRSDMIAAGHSPSVRLFEAAACGTPVISDAWPGLDKFFEIGTELLVARSTRDVQQYIQEMPEPERRAIGERARRRVLSDHSAAARAGELEGYVLELREREPAAAGEVEVA